MFGRRVLTILWGALAIAVGSMLVMAQEAPPQPPLETAVPKTLSVEEAITIAIRNNPSVEIANQEVRVSRGLVTQAASHLLPQLSATIQRTTPVDVPKDSFQSTETTWQTDVTLSQTLYTWGAVSQAVKAARELLNSSQSTYLRTQDEIAFVTRQAYYRVLTAIESVRVQQDVLSAAQEHRRIAGLRFEAGVAPQYDVLAAEARVARVQQVLAAAQGDLNVSWANLSQVMGLNVPPDTVLSSPRPLTATEAPLPELVTEATTNRADIQAARAQVTAQSAQTHVARTGNLPRIGAFASYSYRPRTTVDVGGGQQIVVSQNSGIIGLSASWDLFNGGRVYGETVTAEARETQANENVRLLQLAAEQEVRSAYYDIQAAQAQVQAADVEVTQAQEAYRIAQVRYQEGVSTSVEVLDAQTNLGDARNRLNEAILALNLAVARLDLAVGRGIPGATTQSVGTPQ